MKVILLASTFVLFAVFSQGGVQKCYECSSNAVDCKDARNVKVKICEGSRADTPDYLCYASSLTVKDGDILTYRKCVEKTEENIEVCRKRNEGTTSCYTCSSDLCNKEIQVEEDFKKKRAEEELKKKQDEEEFKEFKKKRAELKSFKCYVCEGKCEQPEEKQCDTEGATLYSCQATATRTNGGVTEKRNCVLRTTEIMESCFALRDKDHDCYLCDTKLCNYHRPALKDDEPSTPEPSTPEPYTPEPSTPEPSTPEGVEGVQKCYFCEEGPCENPEMVSCDDKRPTDFLCRYAVVSGSAARLCVPNTREQISLCERLNKQSSASSCYTCSTNLCNKEAQPNILDSWNTDEGGVTECYTCSPGQCDEPRIEKCDVRQYLCQETRMKSYDGTLLYQRNCVAKTDMAKEGCKELSQLPGISCRICETDLCNNENKAAAIYSPQAMLLTTLISQFVTKLSSM